MTETQTLEKRVALLEDQVQRLQAQIVRETGMVSGRTAPDFLKRFSGIFASDPTFDEARNLRREWREADRLDEHSEADK